MARPLQPRLQPRKKGPWRDTYPKERRQRVVISRTAQKTGAAANRRRATDRAADLAPTIAQIRNSGATNLRDIAAGLNAAGITTLRGHGKWSPVQVKRTLDPLKDTGTGLFRPLVA